MRKWGWILVTTDMIALIITGISFVSLISEFWAVSVTLSLLGLTYLSFFIVRSKLLRALDKVITKGELVQAFVLEHRPNSLKQYDAGSDQSLEWTRGKIDEWSASVTNLLKGTKYERRWVSNAGLDKPEDETAVQGHEWTLTVWRNFMKLRLQRLEQIRNDL